MRALIVCTENLRLHKNVCTLVTVVSQLLHILSKILSQINQNTKRSSNSQKLVSQLLTNGQLAPMYHCKAPPQLCYLLNFLFFKSSLPFPLINKGLLFYYICLDPSIKVLCLHSIEICINCDNMLASFRLFLYEKFLYILYFYLIFISKITLSIDSYIYFF